MQDDINYVRINKHAKKLARIIFEECKSTTFKPETLLYLILPGHTKTAATELKKLTNG